MRKQPTSTGGKSIPTETPGITRRDARYVVRWNERGIAHRRSFSTYEAACAFKRDYVVPFRDKRGFPPSAIAPSKGGNGWVYIFQSQGPGEHVKIGWSGDPAKRLADLARSQVHGLDLMLLVPGTKALERRLHDRFKEFKLRGEWYSREALAGAADLLWSSVAEG